MPLMKGAPQETANIDQVAQQDQYDDMSDKEKRKNKKAALFIKLRRYLRFFCIIGFILAAPYMYVSDGTENSIFIYFVMSALMFAAIYFLGFLAIVGTSMLFGGGLYLKDLFGGSKETRL